MRSLTEIHALLDRLEECVADDLEAQDLDFKQWINRSLKDAVGQVIEMAVCMANGGGGTVVFGVADRVRGRTAAVLGVPLDVETPKLIAAIYNGTDPKITAAFKELSVPEGTGRLLLMHVFGGLAPYTDTAGMGKIRQGKDCVPLTGTLRARVMIEAGETDYTAQVVDEPPESLISAAALEVLRNVARQEHAPADLLARPDLDLLGALGLIRDGRLNRAGILLAGGEDTMSRVFPNYVWTHLRMGSSSEYSDRADGRHAFATALTRLEDRINADNPITTVTQGFFHFEYRAYPARALREALSNSLCHADFRLASPILVKQYADSLDITNPGDFIGGITPSNILSHAPVARNPALVDALMRLRLVNRSNLGINRMFEAMLMEGKAPPSISESGRIIRVRFQRQEISAPFRLFIADEGANGRIPTVPQLIALNHLLAHSEVDTATLAVLSQKPEDEMLSILDDMARRLGYLERGGSGRGTYWMLTPALHDRLAGPGHPERDRRVDWEAAKTRVLSVLMARAKRGEPGLGNAEIRRITRLSRQQVKLLMQELRAAHPEVRPPGKGRHARYAWLSNG